MKQLIIIGAGGLGREICGYAEADPQLGRAWVLGGFLDSRSNVLDGKVTPVPLIGCPESYQPGPDDLFITGVMDPVLREKYTQLIESRGGQFTNVVHGSCTFSFGTTMGVGNVFGFQVAVSCNVKIGNHCVFNTFASIGHDAILEDYVSVHNRALVSGGTRIGRGAELGSNSTVLPRSKVEPRARLGAGSVLIGRAPSDRLMMGVPAKAFTL